jgi:3-phosphoshikimate 1-carboxyvinyltransferase
VPELLAPPVSKSDAHRALVLAEVCEGRHEALLSGQGELPRDVEVLSRGLVALRAGGGDLDCLDAGAPFRFLVTQAALVPGAWRFAGTVRLAERPHEPLFDALRRALGVTIRFTGAPWPLEVVGGPARLEQPLRVSGVESSQFASSLLLGAARLVRAGQGPVVVEVEGEATSGGYLALTVHWLERFGFEVARDGARLTVTRWTRAPLPASLPGDWSSLTYLLPLAWRSGLGVAHVDLSAAHPDRAFATHLVSSGLRLEPQAGATVVRGTLARGVEADASVCPDAIPALVAVALAAPGPSRFVRCGVLRLKESDRLAGLVDLVRLVGGAAHVEGETLTVTPPTSAVGGGYDGRDDHRLVMAAAVAGALLGVPIAVRGTGAVDKSFPGFWREAAKAGLAGSEAR